MRAVYRPFYRRYSKNDDLTYFGQIHAYNFPDSDVPDAGSGTRNSLLYALPRAPTSAVLFIVTRRGVAG